MSVKMDPNAHDNDADSTPSSDDALPFERNQADGPAVMSSLDGRPRLRREARALIEREAARTSTEREAAAAGSASRVEEADDVLSPVLVVQTPRGTMETRHAVDAPRYLIGRNDCDLTLDDPFVSHWHAQLFRRRGALVLQDLASANGVYLRIADDLTLEDGDQIAVGHQRLVFRAGDRGDVADEAEPSGDGTPPALGAPDHTDRPALVRYLEGGRIGGRHSLGEKTTIGASRADLSFPDDALLSAPHAVIRRKNGRFALRDLDSVTGTFIRIADAVELIDSDCFLIGRTRVRLELT